jgi:predicted ATPase/DNA-binding SARP family transcriptional activator
LAPVEGCGEAVDLEIRMFGPMEVRICGRPLPRLRSRKGLWLLALLALRAGRAVEREWLCGALWPDDDASDARGSLRQSLYDLRQAMGPAAARLRSSTGHAISLDLTGAFVDVSAFDTAMARSDEASLEAGVHLRRGPLLEGCAEEWVIPERQVRDRSYLAALEALAAAAHSREDFAAEADWLRRATAEEPFREDLWRNLMQAVSACGDLAGALSAYREFRELLWREMAAQPAEDTTSLFRAIRDQLRARAQSSSTEAARVTGHAPPRAARNSIPAPLTALIGRDEDVCDVAAVLASARLVTLTGAGGIGKTRLAIQVARDLVPEFRDGATFVELAALADPDAVIDAVREAVGAPTAGSQRDAMTALIDFLAARHLLIVLDNCEHLLASCAAIVDSLLGRCPGLWVLATSRKPLGVIGEALWRVPSLGFPTQEGPRARPGRIGADSDAIAYAAVKLFVERAIASDRGFRITPDNADAIVHICRRLDGMPLAIELAAARVRSLSVNDIWSRLREGFGLLTDSGDSKLQRRQTLAATFDWSWRLLRPAEQSLLQRLSVFAGGWTLEAAEAICAGAGVRSEQVVDLLSSLVDSSLVVFSSAEAGGVNGYSTQHPRYRLLETIREYAADRLAESGDGESARRHHRDYFLAWAESVRAELTPSNSALIFGKFEQEHDNLRAAMDWSAARGEVKELLRLTIALSTFWDTRGYLREGRVRLDAALAMATDDTPPDLVGFALGYAGWMAYLQGDPGARGYLTKAHAISGESGSRRDTARFQNMMALAATNEGSFDDARDLFGRALTLWRELAHVANVATILDNLGCLELRLSNLDAARSHIEEAVAQCGGDFAGTQVHGIALLDLAIVDFRQKRYDEARRHGLQSLRVLHECACTITMPDAMGVLAIVAWKQGDWSRAAGLLGAAQDMRERTGAIPSPLIAEEMEAAVRETKHILGDIAYYEAIASGRALTTDDIIRLETDRPTLSGPRSNEGAQRMFEMQKGQSKIL